MVYLGQGCSLAARYSFQISHGVGNPGQSVSTCMHAFSGTLHFDGMVHACAWQSKQRLLYDDHAVPQKWGRGSNSHEIVDNRMLGIVQSLALPSLISIPLDTSVAYS